MNLAVIGIITALDPIDGADRIRKATVFCGPSGVWFGVVGLDFKVGNRAIVFLQDAVLPPDPRWAFMEKHKWRVRMARFKGVPSECVIIPAVDPDDDMKFDMPPGAGLDEILGVTKYSKPVPAGAAGEVKGDFPSFIPKTDEPNFQAAMQQVEDLAWREYEARLKCDGSSCTAWKGSDGELHVASRNWEVKEFSETGASNIYWRAARKYNWDSFPTIYALQFEVVGPGVQGNPMGLDEIEGRAFTLYNTELHRRSHSSLMSSAAKAIGMPVAPVVYSGLSFECSHDELREMARKLKYPNGSPAEGMVVRSMDQEISFKVISLDYKD